MPLDEFKGLNRANRSAMGNHNAEHDATFALQSYEYGEQSLCSWKA